MAKVKYGTPEFYKLWAETLSNDKIMNEANMNETWAHIFNDKIKDDGTPLTYICTWKDGKVTVKEGNADDPADFKFKSDMATWAGVVSGKINSQKATVTGKYKIEGPFSKMMKNVKALGHMADIVKVLDVDWDVK